MRRTHPEYPNAVFKFSLAPRDMIEMDRDNKGVRAVFRVRGVNAGGGVQFAPVADARLKDEMKKAKTFGENPINTLCKWGAVKLVVTPLGEVRRAND